MTIESLAAIFEERLDYYSELMENLARAVIEEDAEKITAYTEMEDRAIRTLENLEKCFAARKPEASDPESLNDRIEKSRVRASRAASVSRDILGKAGRDILARLRAARKASVRRNFAADSVVPGMVDLRA